jgi:hypothetical protein
LLEKYNSYKYSVVKNGEGEDATQGEDALTVQEQKNPIWQGNKVLSEAKESEKKTVKDDNEQKNEDRRTRMFMAWQDAEDELKRTRTKLATLEKEHAALQTAYDGLQAAAAGCPAAGVRVKKGAFDAHAA